MEEGVGGISGQILLYPTVNMGKVKDMYTELNFDALKPYKKHYHASQVLINMMQSAMGMLHVILDVTDVSIWELTPYIKVRNDLPPTLMTSGEFDGLRDESIAYARKLQAHGNEVEFILYRGLGHAFIDKVGILPQAEDFVNEMERFIESIK